MNETMYRIYKGGTILDPNKNKINKSHHLIKNSEHGAYFEPIKQSLVLDYLTYGKLHKIRNFYKDDVLIDYLLSNEKLQLQNDERLTNSTITHTYYDLVKQELGEQEHKILLVNTFMQLANKNTYDLAKEWNVSRQYISVFKTGKYNISNNLKTKIANYFNFDIRLFEENYFYSLIDK